METHIPFDIWFNIFSLLDGDVVAQLKIKLICKELNRLQITDLYNIKPYIQETLNDNILKNFKFVKMLDASRNQKITDNGIQHMHLHTLHASYNSSITDNGIRQMNLHTLDASGNSKITDDGIKHMHLHTLNASHNPSITDNGIRHMNLHTLYASHNPSITDEGIKHMSLHTLNAYCNSSITYHITSGIKKLK